MSEQYVLTYGVDGGNHDLVRFDDTMQIQAEVIVDQGVGTVLPSTFEISIPPQTVPLTFGDFEVSGRGTFAALAWEMGESRAWRMVNGFFSGDQADAVDEVVSSTDQQTGVFTFAAASTRVVWKFRALAQVQPGVDVRQLTLFADGKLVNKLPVGVWTDFSQPANTLSWVIGLAGDSTGTVKVSWAFAD